MDATAKSVIFRKSLGKVLNDQKKNQALYPFPKRGSTRELPSRTTNVASTLPGKVTEQVPLEAMPKQTKYKKVIKTDSMCLTPGKLLHQAFSMISYSILIAKSGRPVQWMKNRLNYQAQTGCGYLHHVQLLACYYLYLSD